MKCPILSAPTARTAFTEHFADIDCLEEECAWWMPELSLCAVNQFAHHVWLMEGSIAEIREKMPHVGQFTK